MNRVAAISPYDSIKNTTLNNISEHLISIEVQ